MGANEKAASSTLARKSILCGLQTSSDELGEQGAALSDVPIVLRLIRA